MMPDYTNESRIAQNFLMKSKNDFQAKIERNKVNSIDVSGCTLDETVTDAIRFALVGSVETTSPTGKLKTYLYHAKVDVTGKKCTLQSLEILPPEE